MKPKKYKIMRKLFIILWRESKVFKARLCLGLLLIFIASGVALMLPFCLKRIVDNLSDLSTVNVITLLLLSYGIIWISSQALVAIRQIIVYRVFERAVHKLGLEVFAKLLKLPLSYHVNKSSGGLMNAIERSQSAFPKVLFGFMFVVVPMAIEIIIASVFLGYNYKLKFVLILLGIFVAYLIFTWGSIRWVVKAQRLGNEEHKKVSSYVTDILMNIEYVHYQNYQKAALKECDKNMAARENAITNQLIKVDIVYLGQVFIAGCGLILLTTLIGLDVSRGNLVVSDFVLFNGYLLQFLMPLNAVGTSVLKAIREGLTSMEDIMDILLTPDNTSDKEGRDDLPEYAASIEFKGIKFKYPDTERYILKDFNLAIAPGKTIALVGPSGSGKSTIAKLLYRLYEPTSGEIYLDKKDIKDFSLDSLRNHIGMIPQETLLLNDTLYANLALDSNIAESSELFQDIMIKVRISDWVRSLPAGYQTIIGQRGVMLSGGERQRIAIARVLLKSPNIIIMDEATSALDESTENQIYNVLRVNLPKVTKIIITHNPKNLNFADEVISINKFDNKIFNLTLEKDSIT